VKYRGEKMTQNSIVLVVSVSIIKDEKVLMIKENKPNVIDKWNFPSGRIETGEDILYAARREVKEETGLDVELTGTTGVYNFISSSRNQVIMFHFIGEVTGGSINLEEDEIIDSNWMKVRDLVNSNDEELRNPKLIKQIAKCLVNNSFNSTDLFHKQIN
jgi:ADP-ribose pyrophosphatase YjhB (NUDIX family)